jgi:hypothetical protein
MALATIKVGNFMSMVRGIEWWKFKKKHLDLLLK